MSRSTERSQPRASEKDDARNELFSHIHRCAVLKATEEQQSEWMRDTVEFLGERYPSLDATELEKLSDIGLRFCRPIIANGTSSADTDAEDAEAGLVAEEAAA